MTNAERIEALRYCGNFTDREGCDEECPYFNDKDCPKRIMCDAADALEAADKRIAILEEERDLERFAAKNYLDKIDELEAQMPKWVSVKDRLPTERGAYLTAYYDGYVCDNEWHFIGETAVGWVNDGEAVRYWMELPEPPNCGARMRDHLANVGNMVNKNHKDNETKLKGE